MHSSSDIVDGSHANSESNEAWDYSGLSKLDLGKLINNAINENFAGLKGQKIFRFKGLKGTRGLQNRN